MADTRLSTPPSRRRQGRGAGFTSSEERRGTAPWVCLVKLPACPRVSSISRYFSPSTYTHMYAYRTLKIEIPWQLVEERPDVLNLAVRMHLAAEEYARRLLKELTGQEEPRLTAEELDRLLTPDRRELAHRIIEEVFLQYGLGKAFVDYAKFLWRDIVFQRVVPLNT
ncbi:hypothetical protein Pisl_1719 [Pyrobaculum islandicum DSM 4184]|uniref:Uncharacterized protein n=1 Tax=Pyrobaculum islandicum (strain DSM 4184 / JCM 9189 / GEO3) TaxID=384616 RepID=A1RV88_PYRIL|nr:hypothetical protein Pisl_1719 [Pyrobaculum islandicum DSM 4184]